MAFLMVTSVRPLLTNLFQLKINLVILIKSVLLFRKAFDLVELRILFRKLHYYGLDIQAFNLIANYFCDRFQTVNFDGQKSFLMSINLRVPHPSKKYSWTTIIFDFYKRLCLHFAL